MSVSPDALPEVDARLWKTAHFSFSPTVTHVSGTMIPLLVSDERRAILAFSLQDAPEDWDGQSIRVVGPTGASEPLRRVHECVFGVLALESEPVDPRL